MATNQMQLLDTDRIQCPRCGQENDLGDPTCTSCSFPLRPEAAKRLEAAPVRARLIAGVIDATIVLGTVLVLSLLVNGLIRLLNGDSDYLVTGFGHGLLFGAVFVIVASAYYISFHTRCGATPGKMIFGLKVVDLNTGTNMRVSDAAWRTLFLLVFALSPLFLGELELLSRIVRGDKWIQMVQYLPFVIIMQAFMFGNVYSVATGDRRRLWHLLVLLALSYVPFVVTLFVRGFDRDSYFLDEQVLPILLLALPIFSPIVASLSPANDRHQCIHDSLTSTVVTKQ